MHEQEYYQHEPVERQSDSEFLRLCVWRALDLGINVCDLSQQNPLHRTNDLEVFGKFGLTGIVSLLSAF